MVSGKNLFLLVLLAGSHEFLASVLGVVQNRGVSFGVEVFGVNAVNILLLAALGWWWIKTKDVGIEWIIAGGIVNLADRLRFGYVRDYWNLGVAYNNLNDVVIALGVLLFLYKNLWKKSK